MHANYSHTHSPWPQHGRPLKCIPRTLNLTPWECLIRKAIPVQPKWERYKLMLKSPRSENCFLTTVCLNRSKWQWSPLGLCQLSSSCLTLICRENAVATVFQHTISEHFFYTCLGKLAHRWQTGSWLFYCKDQVMTTHKRHFRLHYLQIIAFLTLVQQTNSSLSVNSNWSSWKPYCKW